MTLSRRRFLKISAAALGMGSSASTSVAGAGFTKWQGIALGAECQITLRAPLAQAQPALDNALATIRQVEAQFNLHDPGSALSRLNATGSLPRPDARFLALMDLADAMHMVTEGVFDPSIQPLWQALFHRQNVQAAQSRIGWDRVDWTPAGVTLAPGQALSFNGIAQGFATDLVADALLGLGFGDLLINIGEFRGAGGPWTLGVSDPDQGLVATRKLTQGAIATSSPRALSLPGGRAHILDPKGHIAPRWSTVCVEAERAAVADAASTALCLMSRQAARALKARAPDIRRITLVGFDGDLVTV